MSAPTFDPTRWTTDDLRTLGTRLDGFVAHLDGAIPDDPLKLMQIGMLAPNMGDLFAALAELYGHAEAAQERAATLRTWGENIPHVARNIVNQILDEAGTDVATRQRINDTCGRFAERLITDCVATQIAKAGA